MAHEIELKLALPVRAAPLLRQHPLLLDKVSQKRCLRNIYLDTLEQTLRQQRMALRRRLQGNTWLLTLKTAASSQDGLSRRLEWEYPQAPDALDFSPVDADDLRTQLEMLKPRLLPVFHTDFVRQTWALEWQGSQVELALDLGYVRCPAAAGGKRLALHEVELELLAGDEAALASLAAQLRQSLPLQALDTSKAARGYRLLQGL